MFRKPITILAFSLITAIPAAADVVKERIAIMEAYSQNLRILSGMAKDASSYDATAATAAAEAFVAAATKDQSGLWTEGTEQGVAAESRAKATIWSDRSGFDAKIAAFAEASQGLIPAAGAGSAELAAAVGMVAPGCKDCHSVYRGPKN